MSHTDYVIFFKQIVFILNKKLGIIFNWKYLNVWEIENGSLSLFSGAIEMVSTEKEKEKSNGKVAWLWLYLHGKVSQQLRGMVENVSMFMFLTLV